MFVLITYDVSTVTRKGRRRLHQIARLCKGYGQRVQKSVFECNIGEVNYETFRHKLLDTIDPKEDGLRIYHLQGDPDSAVEEYGQGRAVDYRKPLVL